MQQMVDPVALARAEFEGRVLEHPAQRQAFEDIMVLLNDARQCYAPSQYRTVQQRLGVHIERVDREASTAKQERERAEARLRRMSQRKVPADAALVAMEQSSRDEADFRRSLYLRLGH